MDQQPGQQPATARIERLKAAIGDGPHSRRINVDQHLRAVLTMIGDKAALVILDETR